MKISGNQTFSWYVKSEIIWLSTNYLPLHYKISFQYWKKHTKSKVMSFLLKERAKTSPLPAYPTLKHCSWDHQTEALRVQNINTRKTFCRFHARRDHILNPSEFDYRRSVDHESIHKPQTWSHSNKTLDTGWWSKSKDHSVNSLHNMYNAFQTIFQVVYDSYRYLQDGEYNQLGEQRQNLDSPTHPNFSRPPYHICWLYISGYPSRTGVRSETTIPCQ